VNFDKMKNKSEKGLHSNFVDLNPLYNKRKFERAKDIADHWKKILGDKLRKRV